MIDNSAARTVWRDDGLCEKGIGRVVRGFDCRVHRDRETGVLFLSGELDLAARDVVAAAAASAMLDGTRIFDLITAPGRAAVHGI